MNMLPLVVLGAIAVVPAILAILWRVNSIILFTSVAVGDLLVRYLGEDAGTLAQSFYKNFQTPMGAKLALLFAPVVLTLLFGMHSLSKFRAVLHFIPIIATGAVLALLTLPLLSLSFQASVYSSPFGPMIKNTQDLIIAGAAVTSLVVAWLTTQKSHHGKKH